jgi:polysaccharide pyruvyl transferase
MNYVDKISGLIDRQKAKLLCNGIDIYWWKDVKNFGDLITPELINAFGYTPLWEPIEKTNFIGVGSMLQQLPENYTGIVMGSGLIDERPFLVDSANVKAVRGELTRQTLGLSSGTVLGDLGLLSKRLLVSTAKKKYKVGIIPHYVDKDHPWVVHSLNTLGQAGLLIDVRNSAKYVTKLIAQCDIIYSSSLHGLIVSDALNVPNAWIELSDKVFGNGFKFRGYGSSIDFDISPISVSPETCVISLDKQITLKNEKK